MLLSSLLRILIGYQRIFLMVEKYQDSKSASEGQEIRATLTSAIDASPSLRNKKDLIERFVDSISAKSGVDAQWAEYISARKAEELERIIAEENLHSLEAHEFIRNAFQDGSIPAFGTAITKILPPVSLFDKDNAHMDQKNRVLDKLNEFFDRFFGLI